eukprot:GHVU01149250.1.p1 GENE.GHVU01149250.1~~GHVU01149250.1.p1  ORF type:complete len:641 (+),score=52.00 GHVU01149250.1:1828-3750(+)
MYVEFLIADILTNGVDRSPEVMSTDGSEFYLQWWREWSPRQAATNYREKMNYVLDKMCCDTKFEVKGSPECGCGKRFNVNAPVMVLVSAALGQGAMAVANWRGVLAVGEVEVGLVDDEIISEEISDDPATLFAEKLRAVGHTEFTTVVDVHAELATIEKLSGYSLCIHKRTGPTKAGIMSERLRCESPGCSVACTVRYHVSGRSGAVVNVSEILHCHPPKGEVRMKRGLKDYIIRANQEIQVAGCAGGFACNNKIRLKVYAKFNIDANTAQISRLLRRVNKKKHFEVMIRDGEGLQGVLEKEGVCSQVEWTRTSAEVRAAINILRSLLIVDPAAFVEIRHNNCSVDYFFFSTGFMRMMGSLFGDLRLIDDKHGTTSHQYHLAAAVVYTSSGRLEAAAFALLGNSTCDMWCKFVADCKAAFAADSGDAVRPWRVAIVDQDAATRSAIVTVCPSVDVWTCFYHFLANIKKAHGNASAYFGPIHEGFVILLQENKEYVYSSVEREVQGLIDGLPDGQRALREKEQAFFDEVKSRKLAMLNVFSNGFTSQSGAESMFAVASKIDVSPAVIVSEALNKLIEYSLCREISATERKDPAPTHHPLLSDTANHVTSYAFGLFCQQHDDVPSYCAHASKPFQILFANIL